MKPVCAVSAVVSRVVTMLNVIVAGPVAARMYSLPLPAVFWHSIVCAADAAIVPEVTVSVISTSDDVAAVSVAVLPSVTVHNGIFDVTKIGELAVMVIMSGAAVAAVSTLLVDLRSPPGDGVNMNRCFEGAVPAEN